MRRDKQTPKFDTLGKSVCRNHDAKLFPCVSIPEGTLDSHRRPFLKSHGGIAFDADTAAIAAAGAGVKKWTREELIRYLKRLKAELGREVMKQDVQEAFRIGSGPSIKVITVCSVGL